MNSGVQRYTFGLPELSDGVGFVIVAMRMFGIGDIIANLQDESTLKLRREGNVHTTRRAVA